MTEETNAMQGIETIGGVAVTADAIEERDRIIERLKRDLRTAERAFTIAQAPYAAGLEIMHLRRTVQRLGNRCKRLRRELDEAKRPAGIRMVEAVCRMGEAVKLLEQLGIGACRELSMMGADQADIAAAKAAQ